MTTRDWVVKEWSEWGDNRAVRRVILYLKGATPKSTSSQSRCSGLLKYNPHHRLQPLSNFIVIILYRRQIIPRSFFPLHRPDWFWTMTSYQPQHQQTGGRRTDYNVLHDGRSIDSSWIITELARATHENLFSDTVSSPLSVTRQSASPDSELWAEQVIPEF